MVKNTILQHKEERDEYLKKSYIKRENIDNSIKFLESELIKVIIGARRTGKSVFSFLLLKNKEFGYVNFDDDSLINVNTDELVKALYEVYPKAKYFLFDEIQNLNGWELFVNKLQRRGNNLILTGSNSKLLGGELASSLTGRYIDIEILPFSFREYLQALKIEIDREKLQLPEYRGKILNVLGEYLKEGGFPEISVNRIDSGKYLDTLLDAILLKDIVKRYKVRQPDSLYRLARYMLSNQCSEFTYTGIKNNFGFKSKSTVQNYINYFVEVYLMFSLNRFSFKVKEQINSAKKLYLLDNGFAKAKMFQFSPNYGKLMENLVFIELVRRGYAPNIKLFYHKNSDGTEVDFIICNGLKIEAIIQVCYDISEYKTKGREIKALLKASKELNCKNLLVLTWDYTSEEKHNGSTINFISLLDWLIEK